MIEVMCVDLVEYARTKAPGGEVVIGGDGLYERKDLLQLCKNEKGPLPDSFLYILYTKDGTTYRPSSINQVHPFLSLYTMF